MKVPYVDLEAQHRPLKKFILKAVGNVLGRGQFILGKEVEDFEKAFAKLCGARFSVGVNSGLDALILALRALGIGEGDEVVTAPNSFIAGASCIALAGARPVFVDVGEDGNMDPARLEAAITPRTKAVMPTHLRGRPADMDPILEITRRRSIPVVEDCAQAVLAEYRGKRVGSLGAAGCFSFHPLKTLNACGDGGAVTTDDEALHARLKLLRNHGLRTRDECVDWGFNSRLDSVQAAALTVKMKYIKAWTAKRRANAAFYGRQLAGIAQVRVPGERAYEKSVYHTFTIEADDRDGLAAHLAKNGIGTAIHYPVPIHLQPVSAKLGYGPGSFPAAEAQAKRILSLPVYPELKSSDLKYIAAIIRGYYEN